MEKRPQTANWKSVVAVAAALYFVYFVADVSFALLAGAYAVYFVVSVGLSLAGGFVTSDKKGESA